MVIGIIISSIILLALLAASASDIKTREVPDWLSYGLIFTGLSVRLIYSAATSDWWFILNGIAGFLIFLGIGFLMFYAGQWGGGDSKMIMGLGALLGLDFMNYTRLFYDSMLVGFLINLMFIGAVYGLLWSIIMAVVKWRSFIKEFKMFLSNKTFLKVRRIVLAVILLVLISLVLIPQDFIKIMILFLMLIILITLYLWPFVKSVENVCMYKMVTPDRLTEGDWIADDVKVAGRVICGPKDLGIEKIQIKELLKLHKHGKVKQIRIKEGIPFIPSFLIAFIITLIWGNLLAILL